MQGHKRAWRQDHAGPNVAYDEIGSGDRVVLFLPGNSCPRTVFQSQLKSSSLAERARLVATDLPGWGDARPLPAEPGYTVGAYASWLDDLLTSLVVSELVVVGHSIGGHIALQWMAETQPGRLRGLFLIGTAPLGKGQEPALLQHPDLPLLFTGALAPGEADRLASLALQGCGDVPADVIDAVAAADPASRRGIANIVLQGAFHDERDLINQCQTPVALVVGDRDALIDQARLTGSWSQRLWGGGVRTIPFAGHAPQWQVPDPMNDLLARFLDDCFTAPSAEGDSAGP